MLDNQFFIKKLDGIKIKIVAIDPGETTGICVFEGSKLIDAQQLATKDAASGAQAISKYIDAFQPGYVIYEDYRVYSWKAKDHAWSSVHTARLIGAIEFLCATHTPQIPVKKQMAQIAKGFCTDEKLHAWGFYQKGQRHARDAIRHAVYFLLFDIAKAHNPK